MLLMYYSKLQKGVIENNRMLLFTSEVFVIFIFGNSGCFGFSP